ncbi:MAG: hypothetical protein ACKOAD_02020 [Gammaproteobacteria bacterium]
MKFPITELKKAQTFLTKANLETKRVQDRVAHRRMFLDQLTVLEAGFLEFDSMAEAQNNRAYCNTLKVAINHWNCLSSDVNGFGSAENVQTDLNRLHTALIDLRSKSAEKPEAREEKEEKKEAEYRSAAAPSS